MRQKHLGLLLILPLILVTVSAQPQTTPTTESTGKVLLDNWVTLKVHAQFIPEKVLENADIDVDTTRGVVVLHGTVATQEAKDRAAALAKATDGVKSVKDNLRVAGASGGARMSDGWVKAKIAAQLVTEQALDNSDIDIDVGRGAVTLTGTVSADAARLRAESIAKATDGVKSVRNNLKVSAPAK